MAGTVIEIATATATVGISPLLLARIKNGWFGSMPPIPMPERGVPNQYALKQRSIETALQAGRGKMA